MSKKVMYLGPSSMITYRSAPSKKEYVFTRGEELKVEKEDLDWFGKRGGFMVVSKGSEVEKAKEKVEIPPTELRPEIAHLPDKYECSKCGHRHKTSSGIGKRHLKYNITRGGN